MSNRRRVIITGTTGQLGSALVVKMRPDWDILPLNRSNTDFLDWSAVRQHVLNFAPDLVIHAAAATDVDGCERDPSLAYLGNALATRHIAQAAASVSAQLVYISTNFVFDGQKTSPYHEFDQPNPISVYGASKLAGEVEARAATPRSFIIRTAMVFAPEGRNFVLTMKRLMTERERLAVVADQHGNPTYAPDLASAIASLVERAPFGTYHVTNSGTASWYDWSTEIAAVTKSACQIDPIPAADYRRDATPPANGVLESLALSHLGISLPDWRDALRRCLAT